MKRYGDWPTTVFLVEQQVFRKVGVAPPLGFYVGIWWHDTKRIVTFLQSITEFQEQIGHLLDSDLSHDSVWDMARNELSCSLESEYFDIPRGRILWHTVHAAGVVYHGNSTPAAVFKELARIYRLPRWELRLDEHYLTGEALEDFYRPE